MSVTTVPVNQKTTGPAAKLASATTKAAGGIFEDRHYNSCHAQPIRIMVQSLLSQRF
jgi:hypothetical protein